MIPLFDTHQHLVYPDVATYRWTETIPPLAARAFTIDDYLRQTADAGITGSLFMEADVDPAEISTETGHVASLMATPDNGIRGLIAAARPETDEGFDAWIDVAAGMGAVGFRRILHVMDDAVSTTDTFRRNVARIGAAGHTFDMCFTAKQLPLAYELARACPDATLILDHCGVPDIAGAGLDPWREDMRRLATCENVTCKLSGIFAYCPPGAATQATVAPYVDHVLDCFGPQRMVWGSDWPVVDLAQGIGDWIDVTRALLAPLSDDEAAAIGHETARRVYGIA